MNARLAPAARVWAFAVTIWARMKSPVVLTMLRTKHGERDEHEIAIAGHQREPTAVVARLASGWAGTRARWRTPAACPACVSAMQTDQQPGREQHELVGRHRAHGARRDLRAQDAAHGAAGGDHREQPAPFGLGHDVVRQRPELRDRQRAEDPEPHEEGEPQRHAGAPEEEEESQARTNDAMIHLTRRAGSIRLASML